MPCCAVSYQDPQLRGDEASKRGWIYVEFSGLAAKLGSYRHRGEGPAVEDALGVNDVKASNERQGALTGTGKGWAANLISIATAMVLRDWPEDPAGLRVPAARSTLSSIEPYHARRPSGTRRAYDITMLHRRCVRRLRPAQRRSRRSVPPSLQQMQRPRSCGGAWTTSTPHCAGSGTCWSAEISLQQVVGRHCSRAECANQQTVSVLEEFRASQAEHICWNSDVTF